MKTKSIKLAVIGGIALLASCSEKPAVNADDANKKKAIDIVNFDTTVKPQDDFFQYVNGSWIKNNPIPETESRWGSFNELEEMNKAKLKEVLEEAANDKAAEAGSNKKKIGDFYASGMDSAALNKAGASDLKEAFDAIAKISNTNELITEIGNMHKHGSYPLFAFFVSQDSKNSAEYLATFYQGGLGLPNNEYYTNKDSASEVIKKQYVEHVQKMFELLGDKKEDAAKEASAVMSIENMLAKASMSPVEQRDPNAVYNKMTVADLAKKTTNINWNNYLAVIGVSNLTNINVSQPKFAEQINSMVKSVSLNDWKTYLRWNLIHESAPYLSDDFVNENFRFSGTILTGAKVIKPRWKRCLSATDGVLGEALGQVYVEKFFSADAKKKVNEMVDNLIAAYKERIMSRDWMSDSTKQQAIGKLNTIMRKLAYPDKWRDYSALEITRDSYIKNIMRASEFEFNYMTNKLGKPVDRTEWGMTPPTINAYYNPSMNEIVFPAGIMQPPFFSIDADDAVNYGAMGAVIGHELTHGFDDEGSQFDAQGNLKIWWNADDRKRFEEKTHMVVNQFNGYAPIDTLHINGQLTLGENIADLGGLTIAYYAFKKSIEGKPAPEKIDGFTAEQRFFISWAQGWRSHMRDEMLKMRLKTDPHSPAKYRVLGPLANMKEFYEAFAVKEGDKMYREESARAQIW